MLTEDYRVHLDAFEGPMDLLLFLIRKNEVDVADIPIASITDQYLAFLKGISRIDIEIAGEFLLMAATLTEIKSRMLMPRPPQVRGSEDGGAAEDPRAELVRQLLAYKQYRDAASNLQHRASEWQSRFPAGRASPDDDRLREAIDTMGDVELEDLDLLDLASAFARIIETVNFDRLGDHTVKYDDTPIELHAQDILSRLTEQRRNAPGGDGVEAVIPAGAEMQFHEVFTGRTRSEAVGLFLALLELVRNRKVRVRQDKVEGSIWLSARDEEPAGGQGDAAIEPGVVQVVSRDAPVEPPASGG